MNLLRVLLLTFSSVFLLTSCSRNQVSKDKRSSDKTEKTSSDISNSNLSKYDIDSKDPRIVKLPRDLKEISGITMTPDGRLFGEQDEQGFIYQIDYNTGNIIKRFSIGKPALRKDFEDIVFANGKFYLAESNGNIYEFNEGNDGESVEYKVYKTDLKSVSDVEGICFDDSLNTLLLTCKGTPIGSSRDEKAVYSFSLSSFTLDSVPRFVIKQSDVSKNFNPSGIQKNPKTGTFFLIAANGNEIVEVSNNGNYMGKQKLPQDIHAQPEGITFSKDGTLYISSEGKSGGGSIVVYPFR